eukprot:1329723-Amorphochlora_amoeboformis.AAC.2
MIQPWSSIMGQAHHTDSRLIQSYSIQFRNTPGIPEALIQLSKDRQAPITSFGKVFQRAANSTLRSKS